MIAYQKSADERGNVSIVAFGSFGTITIDQSNVHFDQIDKGLADGTLTPEMLVELSTPGIAIGAKFAEVTDRIRYINENVIFDGDVVDNALTKHMIEKLHNGDENWKNLVKFMEHLATNPNPEARANLYRWVDHHGVTINPDGLMVGYKGVRNDGTSVHAGYGIINGEPMNGNLPHEIGSVIEFPRSMVDESSEACSVGLHVGTYEYADGFAQRLLTVLVNPRDVVGGGALSDLTWKYRTCRYVVIDLAPETPYEGTSLDLSYDDCKYCGNDMDDCACDDGEYCDDCYNDVDYCACDDGEYCDDCDGCGSDMDYCVCDCDDAESEYDQEATTKATKATMKATTAFAVSEPEGEDDTAFAVSEPEGEDDTAFAVSEPEGEDESMDDEDRAIADTAFGNAFVVSNPSNAATVQLNIGSLIVVAVWIEDAKCWQLTRHVDGKRRLTKIEFAKLMERADGFTVFHN